MDPRLMGPKKLDHDSIDQRSIFFVATARGESAEQTHWPAYFREGRRLESQPVQVVDDSLILQA